MEPLRQPRPPSFLEPRSQGERSVVRPVGTAILMLAGAALVLVAFKILLVLFAGVLGALVLDAAARKLCQWTRLPRTAGVATIVIAGLALTVGAGVLLAPTLAKQVDTLVHDLPAGAHHVQEVLKRTPVARPAVEKSLADPQPGSTREVVAGAVAALGGTAEIVGGIIVMFFIAVYGAAQPDVYRDTVLSLTPAIDRPRVKRALSSAAENLTRWLVGRLVAMAFVGVTCTIAFFVLKVPLALLFGLLAGMLTFIEYAGAWISALPPFLFAFSRSPSTALAVLVVYTVLHVVEGYVLTPLLARASVKLPPAWTLALQATLGVLAGPLGLTFSTPLLVVAVSAYKAWKPAER